MREARPRVDDASASGGPSRQGVLFELPAASMSSVGRLEALGMRVRGLGLLRSSRLRALALFFQRFSGGSHALAPPELLHPRLVGPRLVTVSLRHCVSLYQVPASNLPSFALPGPPFEDSRLRRAFCSARPTRYPFDEVLGNCRMVRRVGPKPIPGREGCPTMPRPASLLSGLSTPARCTLGHPSATEHGDFTETSPTIKFAFLGGFTVLRLVALSAGSTRS
jgi:hypothetical protein